MRAWTCLVVVAACGPMDEPTTAAGVSVVLEDGLVVRQGERTLVAFDGLPARVHSFEETWLAPAGIWSFERSGEQSTDVGRELVVAEEGDGVVATSGDLTLTVEDGDPTRTVLTLTPTTPGDSFELRLRCDAEASFHGWGEQYNATDQRGEAFDLFVSEQGIGREPGGLRGFNGDSHTTYLPMPWWLDARGVGVLVRTDRRVRVDLCAAESDVASLEILGDEPVVLEVFHGPTPADLLQQLGDRLGRPEAPPSWAWGLWAAAQGGSAAVREELAALTAADIPVAAIWAQDWTGERRNPGGGFGVEYRWVSDPDRYPDLAGLITELHDRGVRFLGYANPFVDADLDDHFPVLAAMDGLVQQADGSPYTFFAPNGSSAHPDLSQEAVGEQVKTWLRAMITDLGMDGWMVDFAEWTPLDGVVADGSHPEAYHNRFPEYWQRLTREVFEEERPDGDWVSFARSGWTGVQDVTRIHWIGDQEATWSEYDGLPTVVPAMINLGLAGVPFVTHDIAGFSGGPSDKELFLRWVELGAFTPIMRTHDGDNKEDNWRWDRDAETEAHVRRFVAVHAALEPLFTELAAEAERSSLPLVRHLLLDWPEDREVWGLSDQYALGPAMIVAPVVEPGAEERTLYLPAGTWFHVWTGDAYEGGSWVTVDAPLGQPAVFTREDREDLRGL